MATPGDRFVIKRAEDGPIEDVSNPLQVHD